MKKYTHHSLICTKGIFFTSYLNSRRFAVLLFTTYYFSPYNIKGKSNIRCDARMGK